VAGVVFERSFHRRCLRRDVCAPVCRRGSWDGRAAGLTEAGALLVYRDRIVPRSEAHFLRRQYVGFRRLTPVWIGCRTDVGLPELGVEPLPRGRRRAPGAVARLVFKQFGRLPPVPDLAPLQPRLIHAHFGRGGALALPIARALGLPLVVTFHGGDATKDEPYRRALVPTIFQRRCAALRRGGAVIVFGAGHLREGLARRGF